MVARTAIEEMNDSIIKAKLQVNKDNTSSMTTDKHIADSRNG